MRATWLRPAFLLPVLAYVQLRMLMAPVPWGPWVVLVALATASPLALGLPASSAWPRARTIGALGALAVITAAGVLARSDLVIGLLVGAPMGVLGWAAWKQASLPVSLFDVPLAGAIGLFELLVVRTVPPARTVGGVPPSAWLAAVHSVLSTQGTAIGLGPIAGPASIAPFSYTGDSLFDALTMLSLLGALLSMLALSERAVRLPDSRGDRARRSRGRPPPELDGARVPRPGSPSPLTIPPSAYLLSGITAMVAALGALISFEVAGFVSYGSAMIGMAVGVIVVIVALAAVGSARSATRGVAPGSVAARSEHTPRSPPRRPRAPRIRTGAARPRAYSGIE